jgi:hypothetical protein
MFTPQKLVQVHKNYSWLQYPTWMLTNPNHGLENDSWCGPKIDSHLGNLLWFNHDTCIPLVSQYKELCLIQECAQHYIHRSFYG